MRALLEDIAAGCDGFVELRYHAKTFRSVMVEQGKVERSQVRRRDGVGVRALVDGTWGFASTGDLTRAGVQRAVDDARRAARASAGQRKTRIDALASQRLAVGSFAEAGVEEVLSMPLDQKVALAVDAEARSRKASSRIATAQATYNEIFEDKAIVTTDGASVELKLVRPELRIFAVAEKDGQRATHFEGVGVTGGWDCLFRTPWEALADRAAGTAVDLLDAKPPEGGRATVLLAPSIVGLLVHEAIGHTVEADFVLAGSAAAGLLGQQVASEIVTLCDSGQSDHMTGAGGCLPVDDEGVYTERTEVIRDGKLVSYLHNRESAAHFGVAPTGNARAWEYADQPLIRMRNTYIAPGEESVEAIIASTEDGYLLDGPRNGQADATAEFMFGVSTARRIQKGKLGELVKGVTITGNAFEVLKSVDAVSSEFVWDLGSGHCGKGQPAKVDAGGPYVRCRAVLAGAQG